MLDGSLVEYVTNLFVDQLKEIAPDSVEFYQYDTVKEALGNIQFYLTKNSLVLYFNQGDVAPFSLGVISAEIPYDPQVFLADMRHSYEEELLIEREYDKDYEWRIFDYSKDKLVITEETTDYPSEKIYSEHDPVGISKITVKGMKKGNADLVLAHVKKGEGLETAKQIYLYRFSVDENNKLTLVIDDEAWFLINK